MSSRCCLRSRGLELNLVRAGCASRGKNRFVTNLRSINLRASDKSQSSQWEGRRKQQQLETSGDRVKIKPSKSVRSRQEGKGKCPNCEDSERNGGWYSDGAICHSQLSDSVWWDQVKEKKYPLCCGICLRVPGENCRSGVSRQGHSSSSAAFLQGRKTKRFCGETEAKVTS